MLRRDEAYHNVQEKEQQIAHFCQQLQVVALFAAHWCDEMVGQAG